MNVQARPMPGSECLTRESTPSKWFDAEWYAWQNPDWTSSETPFRHYHDIGRLEGRDPSPFVDAQRYCEMTGLPAKKVFAAINRGYHAPALGVYDGPDDLVRCQRAFQASIATVAHRAPARQARRPALVVVQAGPGAKIAPWGDDSGREWDLLVNYYDSRGFRSGLGDYVFFQKGTKFTSMWLLATRFDEILLQYDHVLFLDDDVETTSDDLNRMFRACRDHELDLAQMSLSSRSSCNWPELFSRGRGAPPRQISAVEIMMPVFSRAALHLTRATFARSVSGYGLDLVWGKIVGEAGGKIAILDDVVATHERAVNHSGGAFYSYLRRHMINPKAELWTLARDYDADLKLMSA